MKFWTWLLSRDRFENNLDAELRFHIEKQVQDYIAMGMSEQAARRKARLEFGGVDQVKEECRETRGVWLEQLWSDLRYAFRLIVRNPLFAGTALVLVAASIGLSTATFAVLDAVALRKLPVPEPDQLVWIRTNGPEGRGILLTGRLFDKIAGEREYVSQVFGVRGTLLPTVVGTATVSAQVFGIAGDYFAAQAAVPETGRLFGPSEIAPVAVISHPFWSKQFGSDPHVIGQTLKIGSTAFSVIGVGQAGFVGHDPVRGWDVIVPRLPFEKIRTSDEARIPDATIEVAARLKPGISVEQYRQYLDARWPAFMEASTPLGLTLDQWKKQRGSTVRVDSLSRGINYSLEIEPGIPRAVMMTFGLSILVFLAACLTLALLAVARGSRHLRQTAIMLAIGGSSWRVVRPYLLEGIIISLLGCVGGLLIGLWWNDLGASFLPAADGAGWGVHTGMSVIGVALFMAIITAIVGGIVAAIMIGRSTFNRLVHYMNPVSQTQVGMRISLLTLQLAVSLILAYYALVYVGNLTQLSKIPIGFNTENLHVYSLNGNPPTHPVDGNYFLELQSRVRSVPGVESVALTGTAPPLSYLRDVSVPVTTDTRQEARARHICVFPGFFDALSLPLLSGRDFSWGDRRAAVITQDLSNHLYPDGNPLTHTLAIAQMTGMEIVGVVGNVTYTGQRLGTAPIVFIPCLEYVKPWPSNYVVHIMIRSRRDLLALSKDVQKQVEQMGVHYVYEMADQQEYVSTSLQQERMLATISGAFGGLIILLTGLALYAFSNYMFATRTKELAIRAGLGAGPNQIIRTLLRDNVRVLAIGTGIGAAGIFSSQQLLASLLPDIKTGGMLPMLEAVLIISLVTFSSSLVPTLRAIRIDLADALRAE